MRENSPRPVPPREDPYPAEAEKARGATIELRRPWQRTVFIGGLFGAFIVATLTLLSAG
ncbi:MAG: hypothetical protein K2Z80_07970 [Xanthobacteraceae bacterium]|nr:hypothetical protein [Xanthobacteraceae bacterium]